jgi:thiamine-monophosphate kinase
MLAEDAMVERIARLAGTDPRVEVGIGDDAAVLAGGVVLSTDIHVEGVHFRRDRLTPAEIGARVAAANLSDLAAMGAEPLCLLLALGIPEGFEDVDALVGGVASHGVALAGGDLSRADSLVLSVTAAGSAERPVLRSGGRPGDLLVVTGPLGAQAASGYTAPIVPRLAEGAELARMATAMIDLSDGIATDLRRLAAASGCGARVALTGLPVAGGATPDQAATGGEDHELLAAVPPEATLPDWAIVVGELTGGDAVSFLDSTGQPRDLRGYDHFA